jgi:hypothetical protein
VVAGIGTVVRPEDRDNAFDDLFESFIGLDTHAIFADQIDASTILFLDAAPSFAF